MACWALITRFHSAALKRLAIQEHAGQIGLQVGNHLDLRFLGLGPKEIEQPADLLV